MADVSFNLGGLEQMKRPQLQKLCKKLGIKANSKTSQLISDLKEYKATYSAQQNETDKSPLPTSDVKENDECPKSQEKTSKFESEVQVEKGEDTKQDESFKKEMMLHLENKVKETIKESKIPRLNERAVTFTVKTPTNTSSKTKEHGAFKKMDSIDVYLEKKRKRTESFYRNVKKAKTTATTARNVVAEMKASYNTPARKTPDNRKAKTADKPVTIVTNSFSFGHLKSPKVSSVFGFTSQKPKTPATRKSFSAATKRKENKTPFESRKALAVTPFRFNATGNTTPTPANKRFDLQASLSKPLTYKPHKGKLTMSTALRSCNNESKIPVKIKKVACIKKKVDVKNVKIASRAERREKEKSTRAGKRKNAIFQRRGLVN